MQVCAGNRLKGLRVSDGEVIRAVELLAFERGREGLELAVAERLTSTLLQQIRDKPPSTPDTKHPDQQEHGAKEEYLQEKDSPELPTSPNQKQR